MIFLFPDYKCNKVSMTLTVFLVIMVYFVTFIPTTVYDMRLKFVSRHLRKLL